MNPRPTVAAFAAFAACVLSGLMSGTSLAAGLPKLYSTSIDHGSRVVTVFSVRPSRVLVDAADGGELAIRWSRWTRTGGWGAGTAHPDHGTFPIHVHVFDVKDAAFTRLDIAHILRGKAQTPDEMILGYLGGGLGDAAALSWIQLSWYHNPASGSTPWPVDLGP